MGHTRLGAIPKTRRWNELIEQVAGLGLTGNVTAVAASIDAIAAQTLDAAQKGLDRAAEDSGVCYTSYLITQLAAAPRTSDWEGALGEHGIRLSHVSSVFDFTSEVQDAIDRYIRQSPAGATDLSEIARLSDRFRPKKRFEALGQRFFGRFVARFLNFYFSRATAATLGSPRLKDLGDVAEFNNALRTHCDQSAQAAHLIADPCSCSSHHCSWSFGLPFRSGLRFRCFCGTAQRGAGEEHGGGLRSPRN